MPSEQLPRRWMYLLGAAAALALLGAAPSQAAVVTIDFGTGDSQSFDSPYQEDGFDVAGSNLVVGDPGNPARSMLLDDTLTISSTSGEAFSLVSFDSLCIPRLHRRALSRPISVLEMDPSARRNGS